MIKVSVLITTYNLEKYIEETLYSVINQVTDFDYEILIGDDGSTDKTISRIKEVEKKCGFPLPIYPMKRDANEKYNPIYRASRNRVNLISHAKGEYITFLDGDDFYIDKYLLQKQVNVLDNTDEHSIIGCSCELMCYYEKTRRFIISHGSVLGEGIINSKKYWSGVKWVPAECCLFRNIFHNMNFLMSKDYFDDNLITFYFMKYGNIYHIDKAMVAYRQNMTPWKSKSNLSQILYNAMDYYEELRINPKWRWYSFQRHKNQFLLLWKEKKNLNRVDYDEEENIARKRGCRFVEQMFCYDELNFAAKMRCFVFILLCRCAGK
ncbi:MAG: glycosyltransferase family 2 protein [Lachnospiraceae bacterium]|nr:glycosyltransferase family 2 protein [Lachnospiraceae bacterium]